MENRISDLYGLRHGMYVGPTRFQAGKLGNVIQEMDNMKFGVLCLCETRWTGNGKMIHEEYVLIYSGGENHRNGIGIMIKKSVNASLIGFWPISNRVMMAKIKGQLLVSKSHKLMHRQAIIVMTKLKYFMKR